MTFESSIAAPQQGAEPLRALCIARHCFLSEHIARYFAQMGVATTNAVGLDCAVGTAVGSAGEASPDVVICDYDLLASIPLEIWEQDGLLSRIPVIAVSLTRNAEELHLFDVNGIAGFLYLPTLQQASALKILHAAASRSRYTLTSGITAPRTRERS
jgi:DNA-binding NarL/FixJ family response regulator